ncbi:MAG: alpha-glucosidase/alpha-galactosidase [Alphaproteobacteria bacterium]
MIKVAFVGAGSTVFMKNLIGDVLLKPALVDTHVSLMDIDQSRLDESALVAKKMISTLGVPATLSTSTNLIEALDGADFVIVAIQVGGYEPCTVTDFDIPKKYGLRQTIGDTLGIGGIMRGLRTVPKLWEICDAMREVCPNAVMLQYANPMAINTLAIAQKYPDIKQVGLCHSVQNTAYELTRDLEIPMDEVRYTVAGINHVAFFLNFEHRQKDGSWKCLYPDLKAGYAAGNIPKPSHWNLRCPNYVRYDMMNRLGYFLTESSEHFAEYVPWYIKDGRQDLIDKFEIPLDEYPTRCVEQVEQWKLQAAEFEKADTIPVENSNEYAASIINSIVTGEPSVIYGNVINNGAISSLPDDAAVEVPCLVDANGIQPTTIGKLPPQLTALIRTNLNVQELTVAALVEENPEHVYHAAMMDPHTAAELDLDQIWTMTDELLKAHGDWLPEWLRP